MKAIDANSVVTTPLDYKSIKDFKGEVIEDMSLFLSPFGIEIRTDKAIYQVYTDGSEKVAERTTFKEIEVDNDAPWCVYPERESCRNCEHSINPELYDSGCKFLFEKGDE